MAFETYSRSIPDILSDLMGQAASLVRKEGQLARTEVSEKVNEAAMGLALIVGGAVLLVPALVILLSAAVEGLNNAGIDPALSALIVGGVALLVGIVLAWVGVRRLKPDHLKPQRTIRQAQKAAHLVNREARNESEHQRAA